MKTKSRAVQLSEAFAEPERMAQISSSSHYFAYLEGAAAADSIPTEREHLAYETAQAKIAELEAENVALKAEIESYQRAIELMEG